MSNWFKNIPCPNCKRVLRYSPNTATSTLTCFGCKTQFVPELIGAVDQPAERDTKNDKISKKSKSLPSWAKTPPKVKSLGSDAAQNLDQEADNANTSWAVGEAQPFDSAGQFGSPNIIPLELAENGGRHKTLIFSAFAIVALVAGAIVWGVWGGSQSTQPLPSDSAPLKEAGNSVPNEQMGPPAPAEPASGSVATILKHDSELFAIEEYVLASITAANEEQREPHIVVEIKGLKLTDKVRFSLECKKYPSLLNADKHTLNPQKLESGDVESSFQVRMPWNSTELTSPNNRDPMIEIQVEAFVNDRSVINQTLRFHFNEIYVFPLDSFIYAAAYVQPDHPQIKSLQGQYASMDLKWDWVELNKSIVEYVRKEVSAQTKEPAKAKELSDEKCGELEKSSRSILHTYFVWKLVDALQIKYQNLTKNDTPGLRSCQQLRTVSDVLKSRMGNCIEESILLASLMQEGASLMSPPGHCMVMVGSEYNFFDSIPLECTALGASVDTKEYQSILAYAKDAHVQSGLGRLWSALQVMPPQMKDDLDSDPSWRNFASAIEAGSDELWRVFDRCATIRAWSRAKGCMPPFPDASMTNNMSELQKEQLCTTWSKQEAEMLEWLSINDSDYKISQEAKTSNDLISKGLGYWHTVCLLKRHGEFVLDNYVPISYARKIGIVALPNDLRSTPPKQ